MQRMRYSPSASNDSVIFVLVLRQTTFTCLLEEHPYVVRKVFDEYRKLAESLSHYGVDVGDLEIDHDDDAVVITVQSAEAVKKTDLPPFPRSYKRSKFGIGLTEAQLQARCQEMDAWMKAVTLKYPLYNIQAQVHMHRNTVHTHPAPSLDAVA
jgi:hypothetical protein